MLVVKLITLLLLINGAFNASSNPQESDGVQTSSHAMYMFNEKIENPVPMCDEILGCFNLDSTWYDIASRPINAIPYARNRVRTTFVLYTRNNSYSSQGIVIHANDTAFISRSQFNPKLPTKFYIHGFGASGYDPNVKIMTTNLLINAACNVIIVHWGEGAFPSYVQAVANIRVVGREIALMVNKLKEQLGVNPMNVQLIGHSLGAHAAGYAGERIIDLGHITGLDPARPFFSGMPAHVRLDPSDAKLVEVVHTDSGSLGIGITEPIGHLDFYPNGGFQQPGCGPSTFKFNTSLITSVIDFLTCNHVRAILLYSDSLITNPSRCVIKALECSDYKTFSKGECISCEPDKICTNFGPDSVQNKSTTRRQSIKLFFHTGPKAPYCRFHYSVVLNLSKAIQSRLVSFGLVTLVIFGEKGVFEIALFRPSISNPLQDGKIYSFVFTTPTDVQILKKVEMRWESETSTSFSAGNSHILVNSVTLNCMNSNYISKPVKMCPLDSNNGTRGKIMLGGKSEFTPNYC